jgi:hypothetical protein
MATFENIDPATFRHAAAEVNGVGYLLWWRYPMPPIALNVRTSAFLNGLFLRLNSI